MISSEIGAQEPSCGLSVFRWILHKDQVFGLRELAQNRALHTENQTFAFAINTEYVGPTPKECHTSRRHVGTYNKGNNYERKTETQRAR